MKTASIVEAKNNLPRLIRQTEADEPIHLTRHGKPVAVLLSESQYQRLVPQTSSLFQAIEQWRKQQPDLDQGITDEEIRQWREQSSGRDFAWEE